MIRNCCVVFLFFFMLPALSSCVQSDYEADSVSTGSPTPVLRVGITPNAPPTAYREQGKVTGLEAEFAHGLAEYTGR